VSVLFAAFLGYNPIKTLLGPKVLASLSPANRAALTGRSFFPHLISAPFSSGLHVAFAFAVACCVVAALASYLRGRHPVAATAGGEYRCGPRGSRSGGGVHRALTRSPAGRSRRRSARAQ